MTVEICANSFQSAINAQLGGANRIELCSNLEAGGTTPDAATVQLAVSTLRKRLNGQKTMVYVLIRPRQGNFVYNELELGQIRRNILFCKSTGADGIVVGVLNKEGKVDVEANRNLLKVASPMTCTFHRAFDRIENKSEALEQIIELGFKRILTSGGAATAWEGREEIASLIRQARGRIIIMPGAGINAGNIMALAEYTGAKEFHLSAKKVIYPIGSPDAFFEAPYWVSDAKEVQRVVRLLSNR